MRWLVEGFRRRDVRDRRPPVGSLTAAAVDFAPVPIGTNSVAELPYYQEGAATCGCDYFLEGSSSNVVALVQCVLAAALVTYLACLNTACMSDVVAGDGKGCAFRWWP